MARVLLVDDEAVFRGSLAQRLRLRGYDVVERGDRAAAVKAVEEDADFDVIILDYRMPGMKGEEVLREIKHRRRSTPVVMLTAFGTEETANAWACLQKPCELDDLIRVIEGARQSRLTQEPGR
jgi:DNA-binding NtrC family response regulator